MKPTFNNRNEAWDYLVTAMGEFHEDFELETLLYNELEWENGKLVFRFDADDIDEWNRIASEYDKVSFD